MTDKAEAQFRSDPAYWKARRVLLTGGSGFLGSYVKEALERRGCGNVFIPRSCDCDLRIEADVERLLREQSPELVIHLAAVVGGIGANREHPGQFFYDNLMMGLLITEHCRRQEIQKLVSIGTVCAYPKLTPVPFREDDLWMGYPEETNAPYGLAKKMLLVQAQAYREEYGFNAIYLLPVNLYGPRDNFDPASSHVIPALIKKCLDARDEGRSSIEVWGTGTATREFLYAADAAEGILQAAEFYDGPAPVNLGSGMEVSIRDLLEMICEIVDYRGEIAWDASKPDGQPRRCLDVSRARTLFGFQAQTGFREGLRHVARWYEKARKGG